MNNNNPIGIFDSGVGGLTVANAVAQILPNEQIIYFGDIAHLPYGDKSPQAIQGYSKKIVDFLLSKNCKAIVIACNTATAAAQEHLQEYLTPDFLLVDVINPVVKTIAEMEVDSVGVIGTKVTTNSCIYPKKIQAYKPSIQVHSKATRSLVPIIEEELHLKKHLLFSILDHYLGDPPMSEVDAMILGCTHFPIIAEEVAHYFDGKVKILDTPTVVAKHLQQELEKRNLLNHNNRNQKHNFFVSDYTPGFETLTKLFFEGDVNLELIKLA